MPIAAPDPKAISAVVVSLNPDLDFKQRIRLLQGEVARTVIVENGAHEEGLRLLRSCETDTVSVIYNRENLGIAAGFNRGIDLARELGSTWALTLDEDSRVRSGMVFVLGARRRTSGA